MSQLLQVATRAGGVFTVLSGNTPPDFFDQGIPYVNDEGVIKLAVEVAGPIHHYHQGLPFTAEGRLAATTDKPVVYFSSGAPFDDEGFLCFGSLAFDHTSAGIPYTADSQLFGTVT